MSPAWRRYQRFRGSTINDELTFHLDALTEELVAAGMPRGGAPE